MAAKRKVFDSDDSENESELTINKAYASKYDVWRQKEELQKLKDRYHDADDSSSSESSTEDEEIDSEIEKDFFKTLSCLKKKDPKIYDKKVSFFHDTGSGSKEDKKKKKSKPIYLKDYEREALIAKNGVFDSEEEDDKEVKKIFKNNFQNVSAKEEDELKQNFINLVNNDDDSESELLTVRKKTTEEKDNEDADYIEWLKGNQKDISDDDAKSEMKYLHDHWNDPKLSNDEKFLKDYILSKRYLDNDDKDRIPSYDEVVHDSEGLSDDEETLENQDTFEQKYNFRFEEPDQEFIKRYPRTMTDTVRKQDERRKKKRMEIKNRKLEEKERKQEELKQLKALKRKEVMDKLDKLEKITGNTNVSFDKDFLKGDFDPEEHERKMREIFDNEYYEMDGDGTKPDFEEDEEIDDYENWDEYQPEEQNDNYEPHCEDPDFNMDADYQPGVSHQKEMVEASKRGRKKGKSKFAELINTKKPVIEETGKTFEEYIEEYYKLDYEDIIGGDLPCRFKYRKVVPNDFGLSAEEILKADDKELNKWSSLKKTFKYRTSEEEKYDVQAYKKKAQDFNKKKRIIPSLFEEPENKDDSVDTPPAKIAKTETKDNWTVTASNTTESNSSHHVNPKKKRKNFNQRQIKLKQQISDGRLRAYGINPKKYKNKLRYKKK